MTEHLKNNNEFTAGDIERYYSGQMSSAEMHQLEKAAMEDPFLADALEGYQHTTTPEEDKKQLQTLLQAKLSGGKVVPAKGFTSSQFLRIAALFILLLGCGWAVYQFGFKTNNDDIAETKKQDIPSVAPPVIADSNSREADLGYATANTDSNKQITTVQENANGSVSISTQNRHTGKLNSGNRAGKKEQVKKSETIEQAESAIEDELVSSTADARPSNFPDTNTKRYNFNYQTVTPGKDNVIVMQKSQTTPMPEVVLSNRKRDSTYRKPQITFEEAEPAQGAGSYDDYIAANLQMPEEEMKKNIAGEVKLSFDINDAGQAVNIQVEKSLCAECDKEAIRLLKEGPKLVRKKKNTKGKLRIQF